MFSVTSCTKKTTNTTVIADSVLYSKWVPLNLQLTTPVADSDYEQVISASAITAQVLNTSAINVYGNYSGSGGTAIALVQDYYIYPTYTTGSIILDAFGSGALVAQQYIDSVRYVIIPAKVAVTDANGNVQTYSGQQLKNMDYGTLSKVLNIPSRGSNFKNN